MATSDLEVLDQLHTITNKQRSAVISTLFIKNGYFIYTLPMDYYIALAKQMIKPGYISWSNTDRIDLYNGVIKN